MTTSLTKFSLALLVMLATEKASSESNAYGKVTSKSFAKKLRGSSSFSTTTGPYHRGKFISMDQFMFYDFFFSLLSL